MECNVLRHSSGIHWKNGCLKLVFAFFLNFNGFAYAEDWGFNRPIVSLTFDDAWLSVYENIVPLLEKEGFFATFYINTGVLNQPNRFSDDQVRSLKEAGHEIAAHTVTHTHLNALTEEQVDKELVESKKRLEFLIEAPVRDFAAPFGEADSSVRAEIKKNYQSNRTTEEGFNLKIRFDPYLIHVQNIKDSTQIQEVEQWLDYALSNKAWLVFVYHQVDDNNSTWGEKPENVMQHIAAIKKRSMQILTVERALEEIEAQIKSKISEKALFDEAKGLADQQKYNEAIAAYHLLLSSQPDNTDYMHGLGQLYVRVERRKEAIALYERALQLEPGNDEIWNALAFAYLFDGNYAASKAEFQKSLAISSNNINALAGLGYLEALNGNFPGAEAYYDRALKINPKNVTALIYLGNLRMKQHRYKEAEALFSQLTSLYPQNPDVKKGFLQLQKEKKEAAEKKDWR